jgi:hypothetical protein
VAVSQRRTDPLDIRVADFDQSELKHTVFLNSVPKCGTHLIRNLVRMFVPHAQQYHADYIQIPNLARNLEAFSSERRWVSWGHLLFSDQSAMAVRDARHLVMVRDPYDWVLARARFYLSDQLSHPLNHVKGGACSVEQILNMMIFGVHERAPSLRDMFENNAVAWMGTGVKLVRYEDVTANLKRLESPEAEAFFHDLLEFCGVDPVPDDWRERLRVGTDTRLSRTAREHLTLSVDLPDTLPDTQRKLVDFAAPGLRALLGYA